MAVAVKDAAVVHLEDHVHLHKGHESALDHIFDICKRSLPGWDVLTRDQVEFSKIAGGISNILVKANPTGAQELEPVAAKVFGEKTELLIDRDAERQVVEDLSREGFGPKVLCMFGNGRVEEFLYCKTLTPPEMCSPAFIPRIAQLLRRFHGASIQLPRTPSLWLVISQWLETAKTLQFPDPKKATAFAELDFKAMEAEIKEVKGVCDATGSPLVFGHNDLLSGNLLVIQAKGFDPASSSSSSEGAVAADDNGPLTVIDFEYGAYTYRGFDIGNHFNEYAGFECDYTRYPDLQTQELFFSHYLADPQPASSSSSSSGPLPRLQVTEQQLEAISAEVNAFALASHIYWGVWALIQARYSPIDFDYMQYSGLRWGEYYRRKEEFLGKARQVFGSGTAS